MTVMREQGAEARRNNVPRDQNPYDVMHNRIEWYEGWDEEHKTAPATSSPVPSTWNTGNIPGG